MRKLIVLSMIMALTLFAWVSFAPSYAQKAANEEKPTFYRLTPGVYVNGWPRFTILYPKDWVERRTNPLRGGVFGVSPPGPLDLPTLVIINSTNPLPLDKLADLLVMTWRSSATDVTVVSDKPTQLRDGTQAREVETTKVENNVPRSTLTLATKKGDLLVMTIVESLKGKIEEDLRAILYSLEFQPGKDEPVKVPPDLQEFIDRWCSAIVAHDVGKLMTFYSNRFHDSAWKKIELEQFYTRVIGNITSHEAYITDLVPAGDRVYIAGFISVNGIKFPLLGGGTSIIKESGEWKWYGNQRDVAP